VNDTAELRASAVQAFKTHVRETVQALLILCLHLTITLSVVEYLSTILFAMEQHHGRQPHHQRHYVWSVKDDKLFYYITLMYIRSAVCWVQLSVMLDIVYHGFALLFSGLGLVPEQIQDSTMDAKSLSYLWAKHWNRSTQRLLYDNVYQPAFSLFHSPVVAVYLTFLYSGLVLHIIPACFSGISNTIQLLSISAFFLAQATLVVVEKIAVKHPIAPSLWSRSRTKLLLLLTLPLATDPLLHIFHLKPLDLMYRCSSSPIQ